MSVMNILYRNKNNKQWCFTVHPADMSTATSMASIPVSALSPLDSVMFWLVLTGVSVVETVGAVDSVLLGSVEDAEANRDSIGNYSL